MNKSLILAVAVLPLLSGCSYFSQESAAPVIDLKDWERYQAQGLHLVSQGETLYEIAWRYGMDYRDLAQINQIRSPYTIYTGQKLKLKGAVQPRKEVSQPKIIQKRAPVPASPPTQQKPTVQNISQGWDWPVKGKIIKRFKPKGYALSKGIDIAGELGTPIRAASGGTVVYSGTGLRGYGQLIIIKHNDSYLSAYAHNRRLLVKEGDQVNKGQVIAEMGQTDSDKVKLHFEIRKNGQPIDPVPILPA